MEKKLCECCKIEEAEESSKFCTECKKELDYINKRNNIEKYIKENL